MRSDFVSRSFGIVRVKTSPQVREPLKESLTSAGALVVSWLSVLPVVVPEAGALTRPLTLQAEAGVHGEAVGLVLPGPTFLL